MKFVIYDSGAFDIHVGGICLRDCFPGIDGRTLRTTNVEVTRIDERHAKVTYTLVEGSLELSLSESSGRLEISTKTHAMPAAGYVSPVCAADVCGADRLFAQGLSMGGSPGMVRFADMTKPVAGYSVAATGAEGAGYAVMHCDDCTRFLARAVFKPDEKIASQYGFSAHGKQERGVTISLDYMTEGVADPDMVFPTILIDECAQLDDGLKQAARDIAKTMHARECSSPMFHFCSWYYQYHNLDQKLLEEYAAGFREHEIPFQFLQIDVGYCPTQGDWLEPSHHFPEGLKKAADTIRANGFEPGIWVGPFMVGDESRIVNEHPDWLLKDLDGKPLVQWRFYGEPKLWGQRDCDYFVLDTSHPEAMAYIARVFKTMREWGFRLFKTDFMVWGLQNSGKVRRYTPGKTSVEYFRDTLKVIRESIGDDAHWLGCIAPFTPFIGYADAMRIGGDVGAQWKDEGFGPENMIRELMSDHYFNGVYWRNDPDVVLLRDRHIYLTPLEVESLALLQGIMCGVVATSDPMHLTGADRRELLEFVRPDRTRTPDIIDFADNTPVKVIRQTLDDGHKLLYVFNPTAQEQPVELDLNTLLGGGRIPGDEYFIREYNGRALGKCDVYRTRIPRHGGRLLFASETPLDKQPRNMWIWQEEK